MSLDPETEKKLKKKCRHTRSLKIVYTFDIEKKSFLTNKSQIVRVKGYTSALFSACSLWRASTILYLGPLLFIFHTNDIASIISSTAKLVLGLMPTVTAFNIGS